MKPFIRILAAGAAAIAALGIALPASAQNKPNIGVSIPAATHGWTGGVVYWANRTKGELEK
jgi:ribose transport system substrate-binding protein